MRNNVSDFTCELDSIYCLSESKMLRKNTHFAKVCLGGGPGRGGANLWLKNKLRLVMTLHKFWLVVT